MASRELNILVAAKGALKAARDIGAVDKATGNLSRNAGRVGKGFAVGIGAGAALGAAVVGRSVKSGLENLALLENAETQVSGAISAANLAGKVNAQQISGWANDIETSVQAAFDDKDITSATANLIRFGKVAPQNLQPAMVVMTDLAAKTGSVESASTLLGKALADPAKAAGKLNRVGVILTETQQKQIKAAVKAGDSYRAQEILLDALADTTRGAAAASVGPYQDSLNILTDVTEDAQKALAVGFLPVITKVRDILTKQLAKPGTLKGIENFGRGIAGGLDKLIDVAIGLPWDSIGNAFKLVGQGSKAALDFFMGMPPWVQTAVLTGWGLNKITGGLVGELGKGLIKGVLGMNAGVVHIKAGVVTGVGGGIPPLAGAGGGAAAAGGLGLLGASATLAAGIAVSALGIMGLGELIKATSTPEQRRQGEINVRDAARRRYGMDRVPGLSSPQMGGRSPDERQAANDIVAASRQAAVNSMLAVRAEERGTDRIVAAIRAIPGARVTMSAGDIIGKTNRRKRVVKPSGPRHAIGTGPLA